MNRNQSNIPKKPSNINMEAWSVVYPIFLYFAVCQIMNMLVPLVVKLDAVKQQALHTAVAGVVIYLMFVRKRKERVNLLCVNKKVFAGAGLAILLLGCGGAAANNMIALTNLQQMSDSYQTVEQAFYSSGLGWELFGLGIVTPIAEELLYRDVVFCQLHNWLGRSAAIVGSAFIFGLLHMNIVQGIYAFVLGLLLGILMEYYQDIRVPALGHMAANILAILRGETDYFAWMERDSRFFAPVTVLLLLTTVLIAGWIVKSFKKR